LVSRDKFADKEIEQTLIVGVETTSIDRDGNETNEAGNLLQTTISEVDIEWYRNHDFVNIDAVVGRRLFRKGKFSLWGDASAGYNFLAKHNGYFFEENETGIQKFEEGQTNPYQRQNLTIGGQLSLEYEIGKFSLGLASFYKKALSPMTTGNNYYQTKNSHYGIKLGIVYRP